MSGDPGQSCCSPSKQPSTLKTVPRGAPAVDMDANRDAEFSRVADATGYRTSAEADEWSFVFVGLLPDDFPDTRGVAAAP